MYSVFSELAQERGKSVYAISKEIGIPQATLSDWKTGKSHPRNDKMKLIADYFGVTVEYLKTGQQKKTAQTDGLAVKRSGVRAPLSPPSIKSLKMFPF